MKKRLAQHTRKLVGNTKDLLLHLLKKRTSKNKETTANSDQDQIATQQDKEGRPVRVAIGKHKQHRIPFVFLALILIFTSLCMISVSGWPIALVAGAQSSSTTLQHSRQMPLDPTVDVGPPVSPNPPGQDELTFASACGQPDVAIYPLNGNSYQTGACWSNYDYEWGNADITCVANPDLAIQLHNFNAQNSTTFGEQPAPSIAVTPTNNKNDTGFDPTKLASTNENTCVDGHTCYSDNASGQDDVDHVIHDLVFGDDVICLNNSCTSGLSEGNTGDDGHTQGNVCGTGTAHDKFACAPINGTNTWYYNPTAYNPLGEIEETETHFSVPNNAADGETIDPSGDTPVCDNYRWTCPNFDAVNILIAGSYTQTSSHGAVQGKAMPNPFTGNPLAISRSKNVVDNVKFNFNDPIPAGDTYTSDYGYQNIENTPPSYIIACNKLNRDYTFPCSDLQNASTNNANGAPGSLDEGAVDEGIISLDWLSGDAHASDDASSSTSHGETTKQAGRVEYTFLGDTVYQAGVDKLQPYTQILAFLLLSPILVLIGYQFIWASWTLGRANAGEAFGRMILSILTIAISYQICATLVTLVDSFNMAVVNFHAALGYPKINLAGLISDFTLTKQGENDASSFRGIVVPITRWGCAGNDFADLLSKKFWSDMSQFIPFVGGLSQFIGGIVDAIDFAKHAGEFVVVVLSINLCVQVFVRIILLNYYIVTAPLAFACWGLPGGVGQKVVSSWAKGFLTLLFCQTVQLFVLTTFPLLLPTFPDLPSDKYAILAAVFAALPRALVLLAAIRVPSMMGTGATRAIAKAGTVAAGAVVAAGAAAYNVV